MEKHVTFGVRHEWRELSTRALLRLRGTTMTPRTLTLGRLTTHFADRIRQNQRLLASHLYSSSSTNLDGVHMTDTCIQKMKQLQASEAQEKMLRLSVETGGCSGFQYVFDLVDDKSNPDDRVFEKEGVKLVVDNISYDFLKGATVDYVEELIRSAFQVMASNAASRDDSGGRNRRRNLRESFAVRERETNDSHGLSLLKLEVAAAKCDVWRLKSTVGCLVTNFETLKQQVIEEQELVYELKVGGIEGIVGKVIHDLTIMGQNTMYKVAENIIPPMEENGEHDLLADICIDSQKQNFSFSFDKRDKRETDYLADKRETNYRNDKSDTVEEARHRKGNNIFPLIGKISGKDSKVLKYLFGKPRRGRHESREEVARSGEFGVSLGDIQCLWPTISISSKVINIWAAYLCQTNSDSWFLPTFFGEQALSDPSVVPVSVASTIVRCGLQRFHRRLKDCVQIFIPLHDKITKHWFLLVMKLKEKTAELLDSVPELTSLNRRIEIARATMLLLQTVFSNAMTKSSDMYYNFPSFCLSFPEGNPTTDIKYDSGIFVMMQMKCYSDKWFEGYNSEVMRSALALEIVNNQSNELLKSVIAAAMKGKGFEEGAYTQTTQANAVVTAEVVTTECDVATGIIHEKPPNGWKCRSHRKRKFRV